MKLSQQPEPATCQQSRCAAPRGNEEKHWDREKRQLEIENQNAGQFRRVVDAETGYPTASLLSRSGPLQSNVMYLLDLPTCSHLKTKTSTSSAVALPCVPICPGPVSAPGRFSIRGGLPSLVGPNSALAAARTRPGISARQELRSLGDFHCDRRELEANHLRAEDFDETGGPAAGLSTKDRLKRLALSIVCTIVEQDAQSGFRMRTRPDVPLECAHTNHVQSVKRNVTEPPLADVPN